MIISSQEFVIDYIRKSDPHWPRIYTSTWKLYDGVLDVPSELVFSFSLDQSQRVGVHMIWSIFIAFTIRAIEWWILEIKSRKVVRATKPMYLLLLLFKCAPLLLIVPWESISHNNREMTVFRSVLHTIKSIETYLRNLY